MGSPRIAESRPSHVHEDRLPFNQVDFPCSVHPPRRRGDLWVLVSAWFTVRRSSK